MSKRRVVTNDDSDEEIETKPKSKPTTKRKPIPKQKNNNKEEIEDNTEEHVEETDNTAKTRGKKKQPQEEEETNTNVGKRRTRRSRFEDEIKEKQKNMKKPKIEEYEISDEENDTNNTSTEKTDELELSSKIFEFRTTQTSALKQTFERISVVASECCLVILPADDESEEHAEDFENDADNDIPDNGKKPTKKNKQPARPEQDRNKKRGGLRIIKVTEDKNILIKLVLYASKFDFFYCSEPKVIVGIDMHFLRDTLKCLPDTDQIIFRMYKNNRNTLHISSINTKGKNSHSEETVAELVLLTLQFKEINIPSNKFPNDIRISTEKFHDFCKHLNASSGLVEIRSYANQISFTSQNEGAKITKSYTDLSAKRKSREDETIQGVYELKYLFDFSKCSKMCPIITLFLKNEYPLVLRIQVASLGYLYVFQSPSTRNVNDRT